VARPANAAGLMAGDGSVPDMPGEGRPDKSNLLILRASPDWLNFDIDQTRGFLRSFKLPENLIIDFAKLWDRHFRIDYCGLRAELKALALETYDAVRQAELLCHEEWNGKAREEGWVAFVDDDDWMSPGLFESLPEPGHDQDGIRWGSLRLGRLFAENGDGEPIVQRRPLDRVVYTNNYAVSGKALRRFGREALFEHDAAQKTFGQPNSTVVSSEQYLSCAVKHPCCTMSINYLMSRTSFRSDPRREMSDFLRSVDAMNLSTMDPWMREPFARFRALMAEAIQPR
jgi:hypothetical protein